tara:strand:- start:651 stop:1115 length:465 start_codon:yes stop_codon:yes gene_type:complete
MKYIIDAYNLIGYMHGISLSDPDKESQLQRFIDTRVGESRDKIVLVFDGKRVEQTYQRKEVQGSIVSIFTPYGVTADQYMIKMIQKAPEKAKVVIVSSDREIRLVAKHKRLTVLSSDEFLSQYHHAVEDDIGDEKPPVTESDVDYWLDQFNISD